MKNVNLVLVAIILAGVFYLSFTEKSPAKPEGGEWEVMYLEVDVYGIHKFISGKETEVIDIPLANTRKKWLENRDEISNTLQNLYDEGWEVTEFASRTQNDHVFILKRKK